MSVLYDFFPTSRCQLRNVPLVLGVNHNMFPGIPIYDANVIPRSPPALIDIPAHTLDTRMYADYVIPTTSPLHFTHLYSEQKYIAQVIQSSARQFGLIQFVGPAPEKTILIRQGNCLVLFEEVWRLMLVIFGNDEVQLFYRPEIQPVPMLLRIVENKGAEPEFMGKYEVMDMTSHS
jgi:hypothetical protein